MGAIDLTQIGLSDEQRSRIQSIRQEDKQAIAEVRNQLDAETRQLRVLFEGSATDEQLRQQHARVLAQRQQLERMRFENFLRIRGVLTPEQRSQLSLRWGRMRGQGRFFGRP